MAVRVTYPIFKAFTSSGTFGIGYKLYTYAAGTSTPLTTYQNSGGTVPHANPIVLDSLGEKEIFISAAAKFTLTDADGNVQAGWPVDNISPSSSVTAADVSYTPSGTLIATNVQTAIDELVTELAEVKSLSEPSGEIIGGDMTVSANVVTATAYKCYDSTGSVLLTSGGSSKTVTIGSALNTIYCIFAVKTDTAVQELRAYTTYAGAAGDANVVVYRLLDYWRTNGSGVCLDGYSRNGTHWNTKASESSINSASQPPANCSTAIDISSYIPLKAASDVSLIDSILFGSQGSSAAYAFCLGFDGTNSAVAVVNSIDRNGDTDLDAWNNATLGGAPAWMPLKTKNIYWGDGSSSETRDAKILIHAIKLRRNLG